MNDKANTADDIRMKGSGYYSLATTGAKIVIDGTAPLILGALESMDIPDDGSVFAMADMGCADGGTSIDMIGKALSFVRGRAPSRPLTMTYTDLPRNDFSQVFQIVHGQTGIPAYAADIDNLFVFASGTSFHERIFPAGSLHFGFSATASHYISERPGPISNHVHMVGAEGAERAAYADQGRADWERILGNRAAELVSGGRLVMLNFCRDEEGRYLGGTEGVNMFHTFDRLWRELAEDGAITMAEYEATAFPQYYRDVEECSAPLVDPDNPVYQERERFLRRPISRAPDRGTRRDHRPVLRFLRDFRPRKPGRPRHGLRPHLHGHPQRIVDRTLNLPANGLLGVIRKLPSGNKRRHRNRNRLRYTINAPKPIAIIESVPGSETDVTKSNAWTESSVLACPS